MHPALTIKNQVTLPKEILHFLGIGPGDRIEFECLPDGRVAIARAEPKMSSTGDPFERMKGSGKLGVTTDEVMRATRSLR